MNWVVAAVTPEMTCSRPLSASPASANEVAPFSNAEASFSKLSAPSSPIFLIDEMNSLSPLSRISAISGSSSAIAAALQLRVQDVRKFRHHSLLDLGDVEFLRDVHAGDAEVFRCAIFDGKQERRSARVPVDREQFVAVILRLDADCIGAADRKP